MRDRPGLWASVVCFEPPPPSFNSILVPPLSPLPAAHSYSVQSNNCAFISLKLVMMWSWWQLGLLWPQELPSLWCLVSVKWYYTHTKTKGQNFCSRLVSIYVITHTKKIYKIMKAPSMAPITWDNGSDALTCYHCVLQVWVLIATMTRIIFVL